MNKICTDIEQSKKLIELGLTTDTADMCWIRYKVNDIWKEECVVIDGTLDEDDVYAWSLSALLNLIPVTFFADSQENYSFCMDKNVNFYNLYYRDDSTGCYLKDSDVNKDNLIDAAYEMVVWLLKNKKL